MNKTKASLKDYQPTDQPIFVRLNNPFELVVSMTKGYGYFVTLDGMAEEYVQIVFTNSYYKCSRCGY